MISLKCIGCGEEHTVLENRPVNGCEKRRSGDVNHLLEKMISHDSIHNLKPLFNSITADKNPYIAYKRFFFVNDLAERLKINLDEIVRGIDAGLKSFGEPGFVETPVVGTRPAVPGHGDELRGLYIKNETGNVSGSHKARHLMGNLLYFEVLVRAGILKEKPDLAIYSCGNAALGASAVAKAAGYKLSVFIPPNINPHVIQKLNFYGAGIVECPRREGETGDPCYNRFQEAIAKGAVPFSCAGVDNWPNIEGGQTLCLEYVSQLKRRGEMFDSMVVQVGGGALASSAVKTLEELCDAGVLDSFPAFYAVQTEGGYPLVRAYFLLLKRIAEANSLSCSLKFSKEKDKIKIMEQNRRILDYGNDKIDEIRRLSGFAKENYLTPGVQDILGRASRSEMSSYMWCWETEPHSIAHGILDDITYDWFKIVQGLFRSGGIPVTVSEHELKEANATAKSSTGISVDPTGSSGFAGYLKLKKLGIIPDVKSAAVVFTGVER